MKSIHGLSLTLVFRLFARCMHVSPALHSWANLYVFVEIRAILLAKHMIISTFYQTIWFFVAKKFIIIDIKVNKKWRTDYFDAEKKKLIKRTQIKTILFFKKKVKVIHITLNRWKKEKTIDKNSCVFENNHGSIVSN